MGDIFDDLEAVEALAKSVESCSESSSDSSDNEDDEDAEPLHINRNEPVDEPCDDPLSLTANFDSDAENVETKALSNVISDSVVDDVTSAV